MAGEIANPLSGLIDGLLTGHQLGLQLRKQQMDEQAFKTNQALHDQQMSVQDIMNRQMLQQNARPVSDMGTVDNPAGPDMPAVVPGLGPQQGAPAYTRKADSSRMVKYGGRQFELKTPEEQQQFSINQEVNKQSALEVAKAEQAQQARQRVLQMRGIPVPEDIGQALSLAPGTLALPEEIPGLAEHVATIRKGNMQKLAPGESLVDTTPAAAGSPEAKPRTIATGGAPLATGEYGTYLRASLMKQGFTEQNAPPDVVIKATEEYANKAKNPADQEAARQMKALQMQLVQSHIDDLSERRSQRAQQAGTTRAEYKPGDREYKIAQDLAYGKLTMQQFRSLSAYSRDTNKKMDIYDLAGELNPNFNPAQFEMGFKFAANPKTQQQLASMDNVQSGINDLLKFSDAASRSGATVLNKFIQKGGIAVGGKKYSDFHTAQIAFADELSGALGFGGATDMSKQMGLDMTNPNLSPENFRSAVENVVKPFVERKKKSLLDQMGVYGQPGMSPAAGQAPAGQAGGSVSVTDPNGGIHTFPNQQQADAFKKAAGIK